MAECLPGREHHWVAREIGERGPDGLYEQPVLRFEGVSAEDHLDEFCIHCQAYRTRAPHPMLSQAGGREVWLYTTYRGED